MHYFSTTKGTKKMKGNTARPMEKYFKSIPSEKTLNLTSTKNNQLYKVINQNQIFKKIIPLALFSSSGDISTSTFKNIPKRDPFKNVFGGDRH